MRVMNHTRRLAAAFASALLVHATATLQAEWSWIWSPKGDAATTSLRKSFNAPEGLKSAVLWVACDNAARVFLNDQEVLKNDDWGSPTRADITAQLRPGANLLRAEASNEGGPSGFLARLRLRTADDKENFLESDATWESRLPGEDAWKPAKAVGRYGDEPWGDPLGLGVGRPVVIQPDAIQVLPGFRVELLHVVPKADEGSWVSMTVDPKGRIIACDQYGGLYRMTPSAVGSGAASAVERLQAKVGGAHGLLYAFDSLYVMVNEQGGKQGLWRLRDTDGDGQFEQEEQLRKIDGGGEHGPHAVVLGPDGKSIYVICGNHTKLPQGMELSRHPRTWDEDQIVARMWDANGHARGILAPGGYICRTDPDGKVFELVSHGYRNAYDFAFNELGEMVTYDSDMEWDAGTPWYRPTRICLAPSGSELGWRSGSGKWPTYYPDSLPALVDIGPGSPTGLESGRGAKFPEKYQRAIFANDWTYGTMYAIHMTPEGGAYRTEREEFLSGKPLPLTDLTVSPHDGALYFAIGGRRTQSAVYRVSYVGAESTRPVTPRTPTPELALRLDLERLHQEGTGPEAIDKAWPHLGHADRWLRFAARVAVERQPVSLWAQRAVAENRPIALIEAAVALSHAGAREQRDALLERLHEVDIAKLDLATRLALVRAYELVILRLGPLEGAVREKTIARLDAQFPAAQFDLNRELAATLVTLQSPTAVAKTFQLLATARDTDIRYASDALLARNAGYADAFNKAAASRPNQQQIACAYILRVAKTGWNPALRRGYFNWFPGTAPWQGGNSFKGFLENFRREALENVADAGERKALDALSSRKEGVVSEEFPAPRGPGRDYALDDVVSLVGGGLKARDFKSGRNLFHSAGCFACHRFDGTGGGLGPDLTTAASRFSVRDLVENIVEPSKVISDQYGSEQVVLNDGTTLIGRAYEDAGTLHVVYDPRNPDEKEIVDLSRVKSRHAYPVSFMPTGLLNALNADEVRDLLAYILSAGNPAAAVFGK
jgi:putative heme-binding domain-containing protein